MLKRFKRGFAVCGRKSCDRRRPWPKLSPHSPSPLPREDPISRTKTEICRPAAVGILDISGPHSAETKHINYRIDQTFGCVRHSKLVDILLHAELSFICARRPCGNHRPYSGAEVESRQCSARAIQNLLQRVAAQLVCFRWALEYLSGDEGRGRGGYVDNENFPSLAGTSPEGTTHIDTLWAKQYLG